MTLPVQLTALPNFPLIKKGDDLVQVILKNLEHNQITLQTSDILVLAQKIVSKAEDREVLLTEVIPSKHACEIASITNKDPRLVELILQESIEVMRCTPGDKHLGTSGHLIVRHRLGFVLANAGIDMSNINHQTMEDRALLLPENPDQSCEIIRQNIAAQTSANVGVIINDSHGRAWRNGVVGVALGVAGIAALKDMRNHPDLFGRLLKTTNIGFADEIAAAASLMMGQANEGTPVIHIRGLSYVPRSASVQELIRQKENSLFL